MNASNETILVTGGTGFIGSAVVRRLVSSGYKVIVFDRIANSERLIGLEDNIQIVVGDVLDSSSLTQVLTDFNITKIAHLAFHVGITDLDEQPIEGAEVNCKGFINVLEAARLTGVNKVVWSSSAAVYGTRDQYTNEGANEDDGFSPLNVYGMYKVFCESVAAHYHCKLGVPNIALRPTNVFGSGRTLRGVATYAHDLFHGPVQGQAVTLERGDQMVDWLYVKDLAEAVFIALQKNDHTERVFNICGHRATVRQAADIVRRLRPTARIDVQPGQKQLRTPYIDSRRAQADLGYRPLFTLEEAFLDCLQELESMQGTETSVSK